jgi:AAA domain
VSQPLKTFGGRDAPAVEPVRWLIPHLLAQGAGTLIHGQPGVSKTVHAAHLMACLIAGHPFAGFPVAGGLRVLYLDFDSSWALNAELFAAVFRAVGISELPDALQYYSPNTPGCDDADAPHGLVSLEALGPRIEATVRAKQIDVVVCDSLGQMMSGDTNSGQDVALGLREGPGGARKAGAAVLVIDHATKAAVGSHGVPTPMGSQQKRAWARISVALEREERDGEVLTRWSIDKTNAAPFAPFLTQLTFVQQGESLREVKLACIGPAGQRAARREPDRGDTVRQQILSALAAGPRTRKELGQGGTYDRVLKALEQSGEVTRPAHGTYALAIPPHHQPPTDGGVVEDGAADQPDRPAESGSRQAS